MLLMSLFLFACEGEESVILPEEDSPPNENNPNTLVIEIEEPVDPCDLDVTDSEAQIGDCPDKAREE